MPDIPLFCTEPEFDLDAFLADVARLLEYRDPSKEGCVVVIAAAATG